MLVMVCGDERKGREFGKIETTGKKCSFGIDCSSLFLLSNGKFHRLKRYFHTSQCKHLLAVRLAPALGRLEIQEVNDDLFDSFCGIGGGGPPP